ncbi:MAG: electron transport complex subunit RsxD [Porticoccaceae bacterium]|nr:electron transport complex subunit RsxD [Porticoccaceae bacterium]
MTSTRVSSPHSHAPLDTRGLMTLVLVATLPGLAALTWNFGWGSLINIALASAVALATEAAIVALRKRPVLFYLRDNSALVTAVLLGLALPPLAPWWLVVIGTFFAIAIAKHLYGGMGFNPFNPAMVGYVVLLISFPVQMTSWLTPRGLLAEGVDLPGLWQSLQIVFPLPGDPAAITSALDGSTGATPLDTFKQHTGLLVEQIYAQEPLFSHGELAGFGWEWVNLGFLAGGVWLLYKRVFTWHAPVAMLTALVLMSALFYDGGSSTSGGSPLLHLFSGATMLGAFFIVTDPVTSAASNLGRLIYGAGIGLLIYVIRVWGNYPDAVAFAVLLMNLAAPLIDNYTLPRTYGHRKRGKATAKPAEKQP